MLVIAAIESALPGRGTAIVLIPLAGTGARLSAVFLRGCRCAAHRPTGFFAGRTARRPGAHPTVAAGATAIDRCSAGAANAVLAHAGVATHPTAHLLRQLAGGWWGSGHSRPRPRRAGIRGLHRQTSRRRRAADPQQPLQHRSARGTPAEQPRQLIKPLVVQTASPLPFPLASLPAQNKASAVEPALARQNRAQHKGDVPKLSTQLANSLRTYAPD